MDCLEKNKKLYFLFPKVMHTYNAYIKIRIILFINLLLKCFNFFKKATFRIIFFILIFFGRILLCLNKLCIIFSINELQL